MTSDITTGRIRRVLIAGAGPSGSSLAIRLANAGLDVTLVERDTFPRHKLCGEFISPECLHHFEELGVGASMTSSGGERILSTTFYSTTGKSVEIPSKWFGEDSMGALGLSRARMDLVLLEKAKASGVNVLENTSVRELNSENQNVVGVVCNTGTGERFELNADLYVDATGRAAVLSKLAAKITGSTRKVQEKWIGFKAHLRDVEMDRGRCEIYLFDGGYGGLNYIEGDSANHCFLVRSDVVRKLRGSGDEVFRRMVLSNPRAKQTMANAKPEYEWIAVTVDEFGLKDLTPAGNLITVGDSAAFIDPFTGSGMLMALESASILSKSILDIHRSYDEISKNYTERHREYFAKRLRICSIMRRVGYSKYLGRLLIAGLNVSAGARLAVAKATRSGGRQ